MATKSQTTMLRELSAAGDHERTGALDVEWNGTRASLFFVFGHANHVELERADGGKLVGSDALSALVDELPEDFRVAPWRRTMVTDDTLRCSAEELMFLFRRHPAKTAGRGAAKSKAATKRKSKGSRPAAEAPAEAGPTKAAEPAPPTPATASRQVPFDLAGFPLLPLGRALFSDDAGSVEGLHGAVPQLPNCLVVLTGPRARGVVLVAGGAVADGVWIDSTDGLVGADAARAVFSASDGTVAAHSVDDPRLVVALPILWRAPRIFAAVPGRSVNVDTFVADVGAAGSSCALLVADSDDGGIALFQDGELVAVYTAAKPAPVSTKAALGRLLRAAGARATLLYVASSDDGDAEIGGTTFPLAAHAPDDAAPSAAGDEATAEFSEFVPTRVDVEIDALRTELIAIADRWLGKDDAAPVAAAILAARPGVDDFVTAIRMIAALDIPGHENAVVRAMARDMHYRAAEALTGV